MKKKPQPSEVHGAVLPPDEQLACFDYLYYLCAQAVRALFLCTNPQLNADSHLNTT